MIQLTKEKMYILKANNAWVGQGVFQKHLITRFNMVEVTYVLRVENGIGCTLLKFPKWENDVPGHPLVKRFSSGLGMGRRLDAVGYSNL